MSLLLFLAQLYSSVMDPVYTLFPTRSLIYLRHTAGLLGQVISLSQRIYTHRMTQHSGNKDKDTRPKRDSNPRSSVRPLKARARNRAAN
jgi:hypothetical protein